ncbi:MAG: hypothetical protein Kow0062_04410 [Acidobacteriota bacterium]
MIRRVSILLLAAAVVAMPVAIYSHAARVKSIILAEVGPGGENATVMTFYDELTPEQKAEFVSTHESTGPRCLLSLRPHCGQPASSLRAHSATRVSIQRSSSEVRRG